MMRSGDQGGDESMGRSRKEMIESRKRKIVLWDDMIREHQKKIKKLEKMTDDAHEDIDRIKQGLSPKLRSY